MKKPYIFKISLLYILLCSKLILPQSNETNETEGEPAEVKKVSAIPVLEIPRQSNESIIVLRKIRLKIRSKPQISDIKNEIDEFSKNFSRITDYSEVTGLDRQSYVNIKGLKKNWSLFEAQVEDWQSILESRMEDLQIERKTISEINELWSVTKAAADTLDLPEKMYGRIDTVFVETAAVDSIIQKQETYLLELLSVTSELLLKITEVLGNIELAEENAALRLFSKDKPAVWEKDFFNGSSAYTGEMLVDRLAGFNLVGDYFAKNYLRLILLFILFLMLVLLFKVQKKNLNDNKAGEKEITVSQPAAILISRPYSISFFTILVLSLLVFTNTPQLFLIIVALLLYVPLLRILPGMIGKLFIIPFYGFLALYFYHCVSILFFKSMLVTRIELLIIPLLMILLLASVVKKYNSLVRNKKVKSRLLIFITTGAMILFTVTLFTNIIGYFYISELFNLATLNSIYTTIIMVISILIIESILTPIVKHRKVKSINIIRRSIEFWEQRGETMIKISAVVIWLVFVLSQFSVFTFVEDWITEAIAHRWTFGMVEISLGDILLFFITFSVSILIAKFLRYSLEEDVLTRMQLSPGIAFSVSIVVYYIILLLGFFLAVTSAGLDLDKFTILIGALGVGIGFGLQTLVNNFISGLILIFERPIKVGDVIEVGTLSGKVLRIGIRASSIRTFDGAEVIVPNGNLISAELVNWTRSDQLRRMEILVGVAYGTKPERVIEILEKIPLNHPDVLKETPPVVLFKGFGESSLNFSLMFWTSNFDKWGSIQSDVTKSVNNALAAEGIEIPFPRRDVHLTQSKSSSADSKIAE